MEFTNTLQSNYGQHNGQKRYFGKDLTNLETQYAPSKDAVTSNKSGLKGSGRDSRGKAIGKPAPFQFYKSILENQRLMHKRSNTSEANRSSSVEPRDCQNIPNCKVEPIEQNHHQRAEDVKLQLSKFLTMKNKNSGAKMSEEACNRDQIVIHDIHGNQPDSDQGRKRSGREVAPGVYTSKFSSISNMMAANQRLPSASIMNRKTPTGAYQPTQRSTQIDSSKIHPLKSKFGNKFQSLRVCIDEQKKNLAGSEQSLQPSQAEIEGSGSIQNELDIIRVDTLEHSELARQFDLPFMWEYLLCQEVSIFLPRKICAQIVTSKGILALTRP